MAEHTSSSVSLGATARWTAIARATENAREDRLFNDPFAAALAGEEGADWLAKRTDSPFNTGPMVIRTRFFDDFLQNATQPGDAPRGIRQIVILAAGLDTRAYRLAWPAQTHLFELDQAPVLDYKAQVLQKVGAQPGCTREAIAADLTAPWKDQLLNRGFAADQPSAWLLEGFLFYLPNESIVKILDEVSALAAPGSRLGFDIVNSLTLTSPITKAWIEMQAKAGAPWIGTLDDPEAFLAKRGWQASLTQPGSPDANFGRWTLPVIPVKMPNMPHNWYVTAVKK